MNNKGKLTPSRQLDWLSRIIDSMSNRHTPFYVIFNTITLWDLQNMVSLAKWKLTCGSGVESWLDAAAAFEALSSLAILNHALQVQNHCCSTYRRSVQAKWLQKPWDHPSNLYPVEMNFYQYNPYSSSLKTVTTDWLYSHYPIVAVLPS